MPERAGDAAGEERPPLVARGGYGFVRHPIYLGWMLMVWGAPVMSLSRLTFASVSTLYLLLAIPFEERSLRARFGAAYDAYVRAVRWRVLPGVY
jgi:methanethiol S-methyltransferase